MEGRRKCAEVGEISNPRHWDVQFVFRLKCDLLFVLAYYNTAQYGRRFRSTSVFQGDLADENRNYWTQLKPHSFRCTSNPPCFKQILHEVDPICLKHSKTCMQKRIRSLETF